MVALAVGECKVSGHVLGVGFSTGLGDSSAIGALFHEHVLAVQLWLGILGSRAPPRRGPAEGRWWHQCCCWWRRWWWRTERRPQ